MFSEDYGAPLGIFDASAEHSPVCLLPMFIPIKPMESFFDYRGSHCCFIGVSCGDNTIKIRFPDKSSVLMVFISPCDFYSPTTSHQENGSPLLFLIYNRVEDPAPSNRLIL